MKSEKWQSAMNRLLARRAAGDIRPQAGIDDYSSHLERAILGKYIRPGDCVLDIGCGEGVVAMILDRLKFKGSYLGIDPFLPVDKSGRANPGWDVSPSGELLVEWARGKIEEAPITLWSRKFNVGILFATLDGLEDLERALEVIRTVVSRSLIILTGLNIPPDDCHTREIVLDDKVTETGIVIPGLKGLLPRFEVKERVSLYDDGQRQVELIFMERKSHGQ